MNRFGRRLHLRTVRCRMRFAMTGPVCVLVLGGVGCRGGATSVVELDSPDPASRIRAIRAAVDRRDRAAIPLLIDRLEDEDEAVRFYAIAALRRLTKEDHGYRFYHPSAARARAVERWRRALVDPDRRSDAESSPPDEQP